MITIEEVKSFLNIRDAVYDVFLESCIQKAVSEICTLTNRRLDYRINTEYYSCNGTDELLLNNLPVESVTHIKVFNKNGSYAFDDIFEAGDDISNSTELLEEEGKIILKKGYVFTGQSLIEIMYTAGYKENGTGIFRTPQDLQSVLVKLTAKYFLESRQGDSIFMKRSVNVGGAATSGVVYAEPDHSGIINKYRRINI